MSNVMKHLYTGEEVVFKYSENEYAFIEEEYFPGLSIRVKEKRIRKIPMNEFLSLYKSINTGC